MKQVIYIFLILSTIFTTTATLAAKNYRILKLWNCRSIRIGNKTLKKGDVFSDGQLIHWTDTRQLMLVEPISGGNSMKICKHGFDKYKAKTLTELLTKENSMGHRSMVGNTHYADKDYYLVDSLHFKVLNKSDENTVTEAVWYLNEKSVVTLIDRTPDGKFYIITPKVFGPYVPRDIRLDIRERDIQIDLINYIYRQIPIIYFLDEHRTY